jgi:hypothetical protein
MGWLMAFVFPLKVKPSAFICLALSIVSFISFAKTSAQGYSIASNSSLNLVGRYLADENGGIQISYPGVSISFVAQSKSASLRAKSNTGNGKIDVLIDNVYSHTISLKQDAFTYPLFFSPAGTRHQVKLINRSESWQSINHLLNLELEEGELLSAPRLPKRRLLVIGDSVSCGAAVSRGQQCDTHINGHDARNSYGYKLGEKLDAQVHLVCFGGRGIIRSWNENPDDIQAPAFFEKALPFKDMDAQWDHSQFSPDAIIVSLGTNDFNPGIPEQRKFVGTYVDFVTYLNETHPNSHIFITEGAMLNDGNPDRLNKTVAEQYMQEIVSNAQLSKLKYEPAQYYPGDSCDAHPTAEQHEKMAQDLEHALRERLEW